MLGTILAVGCAFIAAASGRDIWDDAEIMLSDFVTTVQISIDASLEKLDQMEGRIAFASGDTIGAAESALTQISTHVDAEIQKIRDSATEDTLETVDYCIVSYLDEIERLPEYVLLLVTDCVSLLEAETTRSVQAAKDQIRGSLGVASQLRADMDGCRVIDSRECISRVVIEILLQTIEVPAVNEETTRRTIDLTEIYVDEVPYCARDRINGASSMAEIVLRAIRSCASLS